MLNYQRVNIPARSCEPVKISHKSPVFHIHIPPKEVPGSLGPPISWADYPGGCSTSSERKFFCLEYLETFTDTNKGNSQTTALS
jgi:hypothetical protein